jgi:YbbR domain-containing protein
MKIKETVLKNMSLKITALLIAITVWIVISGKERSYSERSFDVNVEYFNVSKNVVVRLDPGKVSVKIKGTSKIINKIIAEDFTLRIDLKGVNESRFLIKSGKDYLEFPQSVKKEDISIFPELISINIEEFITKEVPIRVIYKGRLKKGLRLIDRKVVPETVEIFGYKAKIENIKVLNCEERVNLSDLEESTVLKIPIEMSKEIIRIEGPAEVSVIITLEKTL